MFSVSKEWNYHVYGREDGLLNTHIRSVLEDTSGNIWLSTNKGVSCYVDQQGRFL